MTFTQEHLAGRPALVRRAFELGGVIFNGAHRGAEYRVLCPFHPDEHPSLDVNLDKATYICRACGTGGDAVEFLRLRQGLSTAEDAIAELREKLGVNGGRRTTSSSEPTAVYDYADKEERPFLRKLRFAKPNGKKSFVWEHRDGNGWKRCGDCGHEKPLYRLKRIQEADPATIIYVTEGEKSADRLVAAGLTVTTSGGATSWKAHHTQQLPPGRDVVILRDNDEEGVAYSERVAATIKAKSRSLRVVLLPNLPEKGDPYDFIEVGGTAEDIERIAVNTLEWSACNTDAASPPMPEDGPTLDPVFRYVTADELDAMEIPERRKILEPWWAEGEQPVLWGWRGSGKSWCTLGAAAAIASGGKFLTWSAPAPLIVLFVDGEMMSRRLKERLRILRESASLVPGNNLKIVTPDLSGRFLNLWKEEDREEVDRMVEEIDAKAIFFDNIATLYRTDSPKVTSNTAEWWEPWQSWLMGYRARKIATMTALHTGKGGLGPRGTSAIEDVIEISIKVEQAKDRKPTDGAWFNVEFTKNRDYLGPGGSKLEAKLEDDAWTVLSEGAYLARREEVEKKKRIINGIKDNPRRTGKDIVEQLRQGKKGMRDEVFWRLLAEAVDDGTVRKITGQEDPRLPVGEVVYELIDPTEDKS